MKYRHFSYFLIAAYTFSRLAAGVGPVLTGGNFWQGAAIGLMNAGDILLGGPTGESVAAKGLIVGITTGAKNAAAKGGIKAIKAGSYSFTKTAAKHLPSRPYMNSPSTITNIMKLGRGVPDARFKGGVNYKVPGIFNGSQGVWELGIRPQTNTIYHFLFKSLK